MTDIPEVCPVPASYEQMLMRCQDCPYMQPVPVPPSGPRPSRIMVIGEAPAKEEVALMKPFVGESGRELNDHYLPMAGLTRDMVFVTNASRCPGKNFSNPHPKQAEECSRRHLAHELDEVMPEVVVPLGKLACSLFDWPIDLSELCGVAHENSLLGGYWTGLVLPIYHPAAGIRQTKFIAEIERGFRRLGELLAGKTPLESEDWYWREMTEHDLDALKSHLGPVAVDTESLADGTPYMLSLCWDGLTGLVCFPWRDLVRRLSGVLREKLVIFHNAAWDIPVLSACGIEVDNWHDTMIMAHALGDLPVSLKTLHDYLLGGRSKRYEQVVEPHYRELLNRWKSAAATLWPLKGGKRRASVDPEKVPKSVIDLIGPPPPMDLSVVPVPEAMEYAAQDAVMTLRLYHALRRMLYGFHRRVA